MILDPSVEAAFRAHAVEQYPKEACGVVIVERGVQVYVPCRNIAATPHEHFHIHRKDQMNAEDRGEIVAICHSHPDAPGALSEPDKEMCERSGMPWFVVEVRDSKAMDLGYGKPCGFQAPYVGRSFAYGVFDCYTLIRDWYKRELSIDLPLIESEFGWWDRGQNLYMELFAKNGFRELRKGEVPERGDLFLMQIRSKVPSHGAIYLGDGTILHHMLNRLSTRDLYDGYYQEITRTAIRYEK